MKAPTICHICELALIELGVLLPPAFSSAQSLRSGERFSELHALEEFYLLSLGKAFVLGAENLDRFEFISGGLRQLIHLPISPTRLLKIP